MEYSITLDDSGVFNDDGIGGNEGDSQVMREKGNHLYRRIGSKSPNMKFYYDSQRPTLFSRQTLMHINVKVEKLSCEHKDFHVRSARARALMRSIRAPTTHPPKAASSRSFL